MIAILVLQFLTYSQSDPAFQLPVRGSVWIRAGDRAAGTGWVINAKHRWVITARHVVADRKQVDVAFLDRVAGNTVLERDHYIRNHAEIRNRGRIAKGTVIHTKDDCDLALICLDTFPFDVQELRLSTQQSKLGDFCYSIGHRHDSEAMWNRSSGWIRQSGSLTEGYFWAGKRIGVNVPILFAQLPVETGESGSALLNGRGEVIGVVSAISNRTPGLAFAIDVSQVRKLLTEAKMEQVIERIAPVADRPDIAALNRGTVWVRPRATDGRYAGAVVDRKRGLILTTAGAVADESIVDVVFPRREADRIIAEATGYSDMLGLQLSGHSVQGIVLARDTVRDLAIVELHRLPETLETIPLGPSPRMGNRIAAMSHPVSEEFLWLYAAGTVRSLGRVALRRDGGDQSIKFATALLQLPHQGSSSGGPVVNEKGELVGILAGRDGSRQELAYAATPVELREFLNAHRALTTPENGTEWRQRARFFEHRSRHAAAIAALNEAAKLDPKDARIAAELARAYLRNGELEAGKKILALLPELAGQTAESETARAECLLLLNDRDRAMKAVDSALRLNSKLVETWIVRARMHPRAQAWTDIQKAIELDAGQAQAYVVRASLHDGKDSDEETKRIADWSRAIELESVNIQYLRERALAFERLKDFKKAAGDRQRLAELAPLEFRSWTDLANSRFRQGNRAAATNALVAASRVDPKQLTRVVENILAWGKDLERDDPGNLQRVVEWYESVALALLPHLPEQHQKNLNETLARPFGKDAEKNIARLEKLFKALAD